MSRASCFRGVLIWPRRSAWPWRSAQGCRARRVAKAGTAYRRRETFDDTFRSDERVKGDAKHFESHLLSLVFKIWPRHSTNFHFDIKNLYIRSEFSSVCVRVYVE